MSLLGTVLDGIANVSKSRESEPRTSSGSDSGVRENRLSVAEEKRLLRRESGVLEDRTVIKQTEKNGVRRASLPGAVVETVTAAGGVQKPYDPAVLRELADNPIAQTYLDTLAQDTASANFQIRARDTEADVPAELISRAERRFRGLFPDMSTQEAFERLSRNLLTLGDSTAVNHFSDPDRKERVEEVVPIDSATFYKTTDEDNYTDGYVQVHGSNSAGYDSTPFGLREVVWFSWSGRPSHIYGHSPVDKGRESIDILDEIADKEILDLVQGMPPGVLSRDVSGDGPVMDKADWENLKQDMRLQEGERHRLAFTKYPIDYTSFASNYQELQLLQRYRAKVTELGGVFKVNPSYAGFEFQNVNRATDESQREAFKQRGFRVLLRLLETGLNRGVIPYLLTDDEYTEFGVQPPSREDGSAVGTNLVLEFERERTVGEQREKARMIQEAVTAAGKAADRGLSVTFRDNMPVIEDGEVEEQEDTGGGGLFMSTGDDRGPETVKTISREDVSTAYEIAGSTFDDPDEAVILTVPHGGVPVSGAERTAWDRLCKDMLTRGASAILGLKSNTGENGLRAYPDSLPSNHDPRVAVFGLSEEAVRTLVELQPDISDMETQTVETAEIYGGGSGNV